MNCPICKSPTIETEQDETVDIHHVTCMRCGDYFIDGHFEKILRDNSFSMEEIIQISGWIRAQRSPQITKSVLKNISKTSIPSIAERGINLLRYLAKKFPKPGEYIILPLEQVGKIVINRHRINEEGLSQAASEILPLLGVSYSENYNDLRYLLKEYLEKQGYLDSIKDSLFITPNGWTFIEDYLAQKGTSKIAFIAMWYDEKHMKKLFPYISEAVEQTGYTPKVVISHEHNNDINDEIIALIKKSRFLIADFTGQRGGVYFESGLAKGLGKEVIWLCHENEKTNLHFDTSHYNFIFWNDNKKGLAELSKKLKSRIEATID